MRGWALASFYRVLAQLKAFPINAKPASAKHALAQFRADFAPRDQDSEAYLIHLEIQPRSRTTRLIKFSSAAMLLRSRLRRCLLLATRALIDARRSLSRAMRIASAT